MTSADLLSWLGEASLVLGVVVLVVLAAGRIARLRVGAGWIYALWLAVPAALAASLTPNGLVDAPFSLTVSAGTSGAFGRAADAPGAGAASAFAGTVLAIWLAGAAAFLFCAWRAQRRFARGVIAAARIPDAAEADALARAAAGTALDPRRDFRFTGALDGPLASGLARPVVLLPEDFLTRYGADERRVMTLHEAEHVRARHLQHRAAAAVLRSLFWFHPLAWLGERAFVADQEQACDRAVLGRDAAIGPQLYARTLLKAAEDMTGGGRRMPAASTPLIAINHLKGRTAMLTNHACLKETRAAGLSMIGAVAAAALLTGLAAVAPANAQDAGDAASNLRPVTAVPPAYPAEAAEADLEGECIVGFDIQADGATGNVRALGCTQDIFETAAVQAVEQWRYGADAAGTTDERVMIRFQLAPDSEAG